VPNELERLLELACSERGYAPEFYRYLLDAEIYALIPCVGHGIDEGRLRFIMWRGGDGLDVIPFFSSRAMLRRGLKPSWQGVKVSARRFLDATRGAVVVLNPNEDASLRLTPAEVGLLLETGAVCSPRPASVGEGGYALSHVDHPPMATLQSLSVLFSRHASVHRTYLVHAFPPERPEALVYLVVVRMDDKETDRLVRESAQVMGDVPPDLGMDLLICTNDDDFAVKLAEELVTPFYDRSWGGRMVMPEHLAPT
jgi:hypothetical protein